MMMMRAVQSAAVVVGLCAVACSTTAPVALTPIAPLPTHATLEFVTTDDLTSAPVVCTIGLDTGAVGMTTADTGMLIFDRVPVGIRAGSVQCVAYFEKSYSIDPFTHDLQVALSMIKIPLPPAWRFVRPPWHGQLRRARGLT
jgi:hypothetical protein